MATGTYLDSIVAGHRRRASADERSLEQLVRSASAEPPVRGFRAALLETTSLAVIAEIKRRSPSKGPLREDLDPADLAHRYEVGGATCLSVLTDEEHFGGSRGDLVAARSATALPVLRKDFTVDALQIDEARAMGADAVLLIVAALDDDTLARLHAHAVARGLTVLVEVHDETELDRALAVGPHLVGVNARDLASFREDLGTGERMIARIPPGVVAVAESAIRSVADAARMAAAGFDAVLVGEALVRSGDPGGLVRAFTEIPTRTRT